MVLEVFLNLVLRLEIPACSLDREWWVRCFVAPLDIVGMHLRDNADESLEIRRLVL